MNYEIIKKSLKDFDETEVNIFVEYLKQLETEKDKDGAKKNKWFPFFKDEQAINIYKKVAKTGLYIDGDMITILNKGKIMVQLDYRAYKNLVLIRYPESIIDANIVYDKDIFSFKKENGKIIYSHKITDPFNVNKEIIGAYCVIKNKRGEFLEILNMTEINKMRASSKMQNIWNNWTSEMCLKSVIKRTSKRLLDDVIVYADKLDNEINDPELVSFPENIKEKINNAKTEQDLTDIYNAEKSNISLDEVKFIELLSERKKEIKNEDI